jgi:hypothetical protein
MPLFKENDSVTLCKMVSGDVIRERRKMTLPSGTVATVVLVHGDPEHPNAYEIEVYVPEQNIYVLATIGADKLVPYSSSENPAAERP